MDKFKKIVHAKKSVAAGLGLAALHFPYEAFSANQFEGMKIRVCQRYQWGKDWDLTPP